VRIAIPALPLQSGEYCWTLAIHDAALAPLDVVRDVLPFQVEDDLTASRRPYRSTRENGLCTLLADWSYVEKERPAHALQ
jgi:hypothetical protein